jgi:Tfp pilus assembly protein PilN
MVTMITNNGSWEEQTRRLLSDKLSELNKIKAQIEELQEKEAKVKAEAQAYELVLEDYLKGAGRQFKIEPDWLKLLENQTHKQQLLTIAEHSGGRIRVSEATDLLYTKHFIKAAKRATAYIMVQRFLKELREEGRFEKIAPGEYRLIGAQQNLLR